ncbi:conserved hypothetical protein [Ricinus communis]|uniref:Uncharacterized protein n=1 Tax=Ricinus communis TaxID=3988 RepID=B9SPQ5_RICCO|nr:conserved hypothetical protein [Ricinus communis]
MSEYENVVGGRLRLKGNPLQLKAISKKKKNKHKSHSTTTGGNNAASTDHAEDMNETNVDDEKAQAAKYDNHLTPAERRYLQQIEKI